MVDEERADHPDEPWQLAGRCFVITGASSGMGAETARFLGARHARLVLRERDAKRLWAVAADAVAAGGEAVTVILDLEDPSAASRLIHQATRGLRRDPRAGPEREPVRSRPLAETTLDCITRQWNTNVVSRFVIT